MTTETVYTECNLALNKLKRKDLTPTVKTVLSHCRVEIHPQLVQEYLERLTRIGLDCTAPYKKSVVKRATYLMEKLAQLDMVEPYDFRRAKGKWLTRVSTVEIYKSFKR